MVEEAAISHLMHRATNQPKIHFKLAFENDEESQAGYNTASKTSIYGPNMYGSNKAGSKSLSCVGIKPKI